MGLSDEQLKLLAICGSLMSNAGHTIDQLKGHIEQMRAGIKMHEDRLANAELVLTQAKASAWELVSGEPPRVAWELLRPHITNSEEVRLICDEFDWPYPPEREDDDPRVH